MSKKTNILHLSDLHFGMEPAGKIPSTAIDQRNLTLDILVGTLKSLDKNWRPHVAAISGDIAWKGKPEDYEKAGEWITGKLLPALDLKPENLVLCPGNHDIDRTKTIGMMPPPNAETADEWLKLEHIENFSRPFGSYVSFCDKLGVPQPKIGEQTDFLTGTVKMGDLCFVVLNSAWFCRGDSDRNNLWLGKPLLEKLAANRRLFDANGHDEATSPITVALFHHPPGWLNECEGNTYENRQNTLEWLSLRSHIILNGHVHARPAEPTRIFNRAWQIRGGASYAENAYKNHFSVLRIDSEKRRFKRMAREFDPGRNRWRKDTEVPLSYDLKILEKTDPGSAGESEQAVHGRPAADIEKFRERYLRELLKDTEKLPWGSLDPKHADATCSGTDRKSLGLVDVYTALDTTALEKPPETEESVRGFLREMSEEKKQKRISAQEMANRESRLVLLGDPGSGKSTFVNFLAHVMARAGLESNPPALPKDESWEHGVLFPVRIVLREFAADLETDPVKTTKGNADLLRLWLRGKFEKSEYTGFWDAAFYDGLDNPRSPYLILLDGLDEVPSGLRKTVVETIREFSEKYPEHRYLVTCRIYAYVGSRYQLPGFRQATLMPFSKEQIGHFISIWYEQLALRGTLSETDAERLAKRLREAAERPDILALAEIPLLLTTMAILHTFEGQLPEGRVDLYAGTVKLLFRRWQERIGAENGILDALGIPGMNMNILESAIYRVAFEAHKSGPEDETAAIAEGTILGHLKQSIGSFDKAEMFMRYVKNRTGLLIRQKPGFFTFPHRTFQEFLAAAHLVEQPNYSETASDLVKKDPERWRIVFVLAARHAHRGQGLAAITMLCPISVEKAARAGLSDESVYRRAEIAAEALLEIGTVEAEQDDFGKSIANRVRGWLVSAIRADTVLTDPKERVAMGNTLSRLGDPRFDPEKFHLPIGDDMGFVKMPAGKFVMGTRKADIPGLKETYGGRTEWYERETPQHQVTLSEYHIARYPVTVAQFRAFCDDSGHPFYETANKFDNHPVVIVSWEDAAKYCEWLTDKLKARGLLEANREIRLPTEAQWEYAAKGGTGNGNRIFPWGDEIDPNRANYAETGIGTTSSVGCFPAGDATAENTTGNTISDMAGNVREWCADWFGEYPEGPVVDPAGPENGEARVVRVVRGGAWGDDPRYLRCGNRFGDHPGNWDLLGFRVVRVPSSQ